MDNNINLSLHLLFFIFSQLYFIFFLIFLLLYFPDYRLRVFSFWNICNTIISPPKHYLNLFFVCFYDVFSMYIVQSFSEIHIKPSSWQLNDHQQIRYNTVINYFARIRPRITINVVEGIYSLQDIVFEYISLLCNKYSNVTLNIDIQNRYIHIELH